jgi:hypothetical protein
MQISNAASSPALTQANQSGMSAGSTSGVPASENDTATAATTLSHNPSQDDAVSISAAGAAALAQDPGTAADTPAANASATQPRTHSRDAASDIANDMDADDADIDASADADSATDADEADETDGADDTDTASQPTGASDSGSDNSDPSAESVSPLESFAYGTLGLERPDQTQQETNTFYTAGRWLAAGITIGGLISLLA